MDEAIIEHIKRKYNLLIGERTAELIKITIGSAYRWPEDWSECAVFPEDAWAENRFRDGLSADSSAPIAAPMLVSCATASPLFPSLARPAWGLGDLWRCYQATLGRVRQAPALALTLRFASCIDELIASITPMCRPLGLSEITASARSCRPWTEPARQFGLAGERRHGRGRSGSRPD